MKKKAKFRRLQNGLGIASGLAIVGILLLLAFDPGALPGVPSPALTTSSPSITSGTTTTPNTDGTLPSGISTAPSSTAAPTSTSIGSPKPPTNNKNATGTHSNTAATTPTTISTRSQVSGATTSTTIATTDPSPSGASAPTTTTTQPPGVAVSTTTTAPTTTTTPTTTPASPSSSTVTEVFAPWTTGGELAPGIQVAANLNDGSCSTASLADGANQNAWRCSSGKGVYDPCFAPPDETNVTQVACAQSPLSAVEMLTLATPLPSSSTAPSSSTGSTPVPWFMQLANGDTCGRTTAAASSAGSPSPSYGCQSGVASALNTSTEPWTVEYLPNNSDVSSDVVVSTAWN
jgi:hypothetical protein